jgi:hypothetical protein
MVIIELEKKKKEYELGLCEREDLVFWSIPLGKFSNWSMGDPHAPLNPFLSLDTQFEEISMLK